MQSAKNRITQIVQDYIRLNPSEWKAFKKGMVAVRASIKDDEFATLEGTKYTRALYEMPETLQMMFIKQLPEDEMIWLKAGVDSNHNQGGQWFAKAFPDFRIPKEV